MKTKIFLAFIVVILAALFSNFIFEWLILKDFDNYAQGIRDDQFYWILASVEGGYFNNRWDTKALSETIHWAMMIGLDIRVLDINGKEIISSKEVMDSLSDTMRQRMEGRFHMHKTGGKFVEYPLYMSGQRIGTLLSRPFHKETIQEKENRFKKRTKNFLMVSSIIAGGGAIVLAMLLSRYLSNPITTLKVAVEQIAKGNFDVNIKTGGKDEVGELSKSFNLMAESLRREEKLRKHLMSNIAHELRTPLTIMKTHLEAIEDGIIEDMSKGLENIKNELSRLIRLVKGIEDITAAEASFFVKEEETRINLKEFLNELAKEMQPAFKERGLTLEICTDTDIITMTDIEKLERVVRNIISNSLKFTETGGVWISYGYERDECFIEIRDSGKGIPDKEIPFIFKRFYRAGETKTEGIGLGLAIAKELITIMGGRIEVQSIVNKGTIFRVYLPFKQEGIYA